MASISILIIAFIISIVTMGQIKMIFVGNILFYLLLLYQRKIKVFNMNVLRAYIFFAIEVFLSTIYYYIFLGGEFSFSAIIQFIFTLQYFIFCIELDIDIEFFEKWFKYIALIWAIIILVFFFNSIRSIKPNELVQFYINKRDWGVNIFNGWPNSTGQPLVFALFLYFSTSKSFFRNWIPKILITLACIVTTSRTSLLGCGLIIIYYLIWPQSHNIYLYLKKHIPLIGISLAFLAGTIIFLTQHSEIISRLFYAQDRFDILEIVLEVIPYSLLLGFGGTSLDNIISLVGITGAPNFTHTHNFVLEILVRYGILGLVLFSCMLILMYTNLKKNENKMIFIVFWIMALMQIYVREFVFLYLIIYICHRDKMLNVYQDKCEKGIKK